MKITVAELASQLGGTWEGKPDTILSRVARIEEAGPDSLTFLANPLYEEHLYKSKPAAVLVDKNFKPRFALETTLIRIQNPYEAFVEVLRRIAETKQKIGIESNCFVGKCVHLGNHIYVGSFSYIGDNSSIGDYVKIFPQVYIGENVIIGDHTVVYPGARILDNCIIGKDCIIHANAVIGSDGFGFAPQKDAKYKKIPQIGNVIIEDDVEIGANTTIDRATIGSTIIRKGVKLDNLIQLAHNVEIGEHTVMAAQSGVAGSTKIGSHCSIGGQVGIIGHLTIADEVKIAAQSGVGKSIVKKGEVVQGSPAFCINEYRKCYVHFRNLSKLVSRIEILEQQIRSGQL